MPVIGHALAGILIAREFEPTGPRNSWAAGPVTRALWMPALVALSYLPDIATQIGVWLRYESAQAAGHSIPFGLIAGAIAGAAWARATGGSARWLAALAAGVVALHDVFDLLQDVERMPLWPFSTREMGVDWLAFSDRLWGEALVFGVPFVLFEVWRFVRGRAPAIASTPSFRSRQFAWLGRGLVGALLISTIGVLYLRDDRERQMDEARALLRAGKAQDALTAIAGAERWPSFAGAGDLTRGEAYDRMGDAARAEAALLRAVERNPDDFWPTAVLAVHYASHGTREERRRRSAPYIDVLQRRFADHDALRGVLRRIGRQVLQGSQ